MTGFVEVLFSCARCKLTEHKVKVRERYSEAEPKEQWMFAVREAVTRAHHKQKPFCSSTELELRFTIKKNGYIGQATTNE